MVSYFLDNNDFRDLQDIVNQLVDIANSLGNPGDLETSAQNVIEAINELNSELGDILTLNTTDKTSIVAAVNEIVTNIGSIPSLTTTDKTSIVAAVNELVSRLDFNRADIDGVISELANRSGNNPTIVTGTAGTPNNFVIWDSNGNVSDSTYSLKDLLIINEIMGD